MNRIIWKHPLQRDVLTTLDLTVGAYILHVASQDGWLCLWEAHDPTETRTEQRAFRIVGTGNGEDFNPSRHIGTILVDSGQWVWHVFEVT